MPEETVSPAEYSKQVVDALVGVISGVASPEALRAQQLILQRLALQGDVIPSRVPAPKNISEIGGYLNLLTTLEQTDLQAQVLASVLGVAGPYPPAGWPGPGPIVYPLNQPNHRPTEGGIQSSIPVSFAVRSDFFTALEGAMASLASHGCALPVLRTLAPLPLATDPIPEGQDLLGVVGRLLRLVPSAALRDPDADPLALARPGGGGTLRVVARLLDDTATDAAAVAEVAWDAFSCDAGVCAADTADRNYLDLAPLLNGAGWYQAEPSLPTTITEPGSWATWTNSTGLVAGETRFGDELALLHTPEAIAASSVREQVGRVWDGTAFS